MALLFFATPPMRLQLTTEKISQQLKKSISEALTSFYPLAGRIKDNVFIQCNDEGVIYVEARVNTLISTFLDQPDFDILKSCLPIEIGSPEAAPGMLHFFECGGLAIGVCVSHKLADVPTLGTFIKAWKCADTYKS